MGRSARVSRLAVVMCALAIPVRSADGSLALSIVDRASGLDHATVFPGDTIFLDVLVDGLASDSFTFAKFDVNFSDPGLSYQSYAFNSPLLAPAGGGDDASVPGLDDLPATITAALFHPFFDPGLIDVRFNILTGEGPGGALVFNPSTDHLLVTLELLVPLDFLDSSVGAKTMTISPEPVRFHREPLGEFFDESLSFELSVTPEPGTLGLLGVGGVFAVIRRRRR